MTQNHLSYSVVEVYSQKGLESISTYQSHCTHETTEAQGRGGAHSFNHSEEWGSQHSLGPLGPETAFYHSIQRIRHILYYVLSGALRHLKEDIQSSLYKPRQDYIISPTKPL